MCKVLDQIKRSGIEQGIKQGIEKGIKQGMERERVSNIRSIMKSTGFTLDKVLGMLGIPTAESAHYATLLQA